MATKTESALQGPQTFKNCMDCPHHKVELDPDPSDWFCDDDEKVVCTKKKDKAITVACRPYNKRKECETPRWCPLLQEKRKNERPN